MSNITHNTCVNRHLHRLLLNIYSLGAHIFLLVFILVVSFFLTKEIGKRQRSLEAVRGTKSTQLRRWHMKLDIVILLVNRDGRRRVDPQCKDALKQWPD